MTTSSTTPDLPSGDLSRRLLPWLVAVAMFMEQLDTTILNTAVPTIARALGVASLNMKAALTSYMLSLAVFIPISGWIADRFGTRRVFFSAIGLFTFGSLLCGLAMNMPMLVASRVVQGCGGALMVPVGRIALVRTFRKSELLRAWSFVSMLAMIGPFLGPLAGGFIVDYLNWRIIFLVNLPMGFFGLYMAFRHMPDYRAAKSDPLDFVGLVLFSSGILLFMTIGLGTPSWVIATEAFFFGLFSSIQYICMNTLAFADLDDADESNGSSIASTVQQMSLSFGVAIASLATILFLGGNRIPGPAAMVRGIHHTFLVMGLFTMATAWVFKDLRPDDGGSVSRLH